MRPTAPRRLAATAAGLAVAALLTLIATAAGAAQPPQTAMSCGPLRTSGTSGTHGGGALMVPVTLDEVTGQSSLVIVGAVTGFQSCGGSEPRSIRTYVTVMPERVLKGAASGPLRLAVPGGVFGGYGLGVGTSPEFTAGERAVIFTARRGSDLVPVQGYQGKLDVTPGGRVQGTDLTLDGLADSVRRAARGTLTQAENFSMGEAAAESPQYADTGRRWPVTSIPVSRYMNVNDARPAQLSAPDVRKAIIRALHTWQNVPGSYIAFGPLVETAQTSAQGACDGFNNTSFGIYDPGHPPGTLAVTYTCYGQISLNILDADVEIDVDHFGPYWRTSAAGNCFETFDLETVLLHEYGHSLGLGHPSGTGGCTPCPVMDESYGGVQRTLCPDDAAGAAALYPLTPSAPPAAPGIGGSSRNGAITVNWANVAAELGFEVWRAPLPCDLAIAVDFDLVETVPTDALAYADDDHGNSLDPGTTYCHRVRAFNTGGDSAFSQAVRSDGPPPTLTLGDTNCDGNIGAADALGVLRHVAGLTGGPACIASGDADCDGSVTAVDALRILRYVAGLGTPIPPAC